MCPVTQTYKDTWQALIGLCDWMMMNCDVWFVQLYKSGWDTCHKLTGPFGEKLERGHLECFESLIDTNEAPPRQRAVYFYICLIPSLTMDSKRVTVKHLPSYTVYTRETLSNSVNT